MSRILIIEDEESIAELRKIIWNWSGFEVEIESKGRRWTQTCPGRRI